MLPSHPIAFCRVNMIYSETRSTARLPAKLCANHWFFLRTKACCRSSPTDICWSLVKAPMTLPANRVVGRSLGRAQGLITATSPARPRFTPALLMHSKAAAVRVNCHPMVALPSGPMWQSLCSARSPTRNSKATARHWRSMTISPALMRQCAS